MFLCIPHQSLMVGQSGQTTIARKDPHLKNVAPASPHDSQETIWLYEDSKLSSVVDYRISPTLASQLRALTWQYDMWLHVTYGV